MPAAPLRCEPPPEHRGHRWHWLTKKGRKRPVIATMIDGRWYRPTTMYDQHTPAQAHAAGWRYLSPAIPPEAG